MYCLELSGSSDSSVNFGGLSVAEEDTQTNTHRYTHIFALLLFLRFEKGMKQ